MIDRRYEEIDRGCDWVDGILRWRSGELEAWSGSRDDAFRDRTTFRPSGPSAAIHRRSTCNHRVLCGGNLIYASLLFREQRRVGAGRNLITVWAQYLPNLKRWKPRQLEQWVPVHAAQDCIAEDIRVESKQHSPHFVYVI